jgi:enamine deaminase RidA (YjgF/YER057c/UK114 family)
LGGTDFANFGNSSMMNPILKRLSEAGLALPDPPQPGGHYLPWQRHGRLLYLAGVISSRGGQVIKGRLGDDMTVEQGFEAARECALLQLAALQQALVSLENVSQIVSLNGYVRCTPDFCDSPKVINGASDLFIHLYGDQGRHARAAIGVASLPAGAAVEVQMIVEIHARS